MKIAIFGASGATGLFLTQRCLAAGYPITALVRKPETFPLRLSVRMVKGSAFDLAVGKIPADSIPHATTGENSSSYIIDGLQNSVTYAVAKVVVAADYVKARRLQGAGHWAIITTDVLPNCLSPIIVQATLLVAIGIVIEASVSFVGLGVQPPQASWGTMLSDARNAIFSGEWWLPVFPGLAISLTVIGFNLFGDAVRDLFDPHSVTRTVIA